jgi:hypothetical protein
MAAWNRMRVSHAQSYTPLPLSEKEPLSPVRPRASRWSRWSFVGLTLCIVGALFALYGIFRYLTTVGWIWLLR